MTKACTFKVQPYSEVLFLETGDVIGTIAPSLDHRVKENSDDKKSIFFNSLAIYFEVEVFRCFCEYQCKLQICSLNFRLVENLFSSSTSASRPLWSQLKLASFLEYVVHYFAPFRSKH